MFECSGYTRHQTIRPPPPAARNRAERGANSNLVHLVNFASVEVTQADAVERKIADELSIHFTLVFIN